MLYKVFNSLKEVLGQDYFASHVSDEIVENLNPKFELREYQKEAYRTLLRTGTYFRGAEFFRRVLTSREIKLKPKIVNIASLSC